ncbi:TlpA disulfide reductase family protein [Croceimicrobium sp.]|uniref:TlpA disulfide reductase family protein n=1 Tax=Croceimicrobium sp. TaxID=2828340 RepID=UPI003BA97169
MKYSNYLLGFICFTSISFAQSTMREAPDYPWMNQKIPIDRFISFQGDTSLLFQADTVYLLSFWYSSCPPCLAEIPALNELKEDFKDQKIRFLAITFDSQEELSQLLAMQPFDFEHFQMDRNLINQNQLAFGYPTNLLLDANGIVRYQKSGGHTDPEKAWEIYDLMREEIDKLMSER